MKASRYICFLLIFFLSAHSAYCDEMLGIYGCSGYYSGFSTNYKNTQTKMTLKVAHDIVYLDGDYDFFGTNIKNPLDGLSFLNCGMLVPPNLSAQQKTCKILDSNGLPIFFTDKNFVMQDELTLSMATMRAEVFFIEDDAKANFDCVKTEY